MKLSDYIVTFLQKKGIRTVIFDISDSFTKEAIIRNLSAGGNDKVRQQVEDYVNDKFNEASVDKKKSQNKDEIVYEVIDDNLYLGGKNGR